MKVLFIYPITPPRFDLFGIQQGIAVLSAVLKQHGHETRLYSHFEFLPDELDQLVESFRPGVVGMHVTYPQADLSLEIAAHLHRRHGLDVILAGVWPTTCGDEAIASPDVRGLCRGEGEQSFLEFVEAHERGEPYEDLQGFWFRKDGEIRRNQPAPYVHDLDALPFPDRELFAGQRYMNRVPYLEFIGQRGCPTGCTNCFHHTWMKNLTGSRGYVRFKSPRRFVDEIADTVARYPLGQGEQCLGFHDPTFTLNRKWALEVCELLEAEVGIPWWCNTRASCLDAEIVDRMKRSGCFEVHIGVESGDSYLRNEILNKDIQDEDLVEAFDLLREYGMLTFGFNMLGLPYETEESLRKTVELNRRLAPDTVFVSVFNPFPGTDLYDLVVDKGWLSDRVVQSYFEHTSVLDQPSVDADVVGHYHKFFRLMVKHPHIASGLRPLDKVRLPGRSRTVYDSLDSRFGQSSRWRKELIKLLPQSTKDRIKRLIHW